MWFRSIEVLQEHLYLECELMSEKCSGCHILTPRFQIINHECFKADDYETKWLCPSCKIVSDPLAPCPKCRKDI